MISQRRKTQHAGRAEKPGFPAVGGSRYRTHSKSRAADRGFTLFEVILALALSTLLFALIAGSVHLLLWSLDAGRGEVEEAQLARSVLGLIAEDLQSALLLEVQDVATISGLAEASAAFDVDSIDEQTPLAPEDDAAASSAEDIAASSTVPAIPGIYGNQFEIQVDRSRLPRLDEFELLALAEQAATSDRISDVKTVAYYLAGEVASSGAIAAATDVPTGSGLVRRELDRAAAIYASSNGLTMPLDRHTQVLATEITAIEFSYFDGTQQWVAWDTAQQGGLPMAVQIRIWIRPFSAPQAKAEVPAIRQAGRQPGDLEYRLTVRLPQGVPTGTTDAANESLDDGGASGTTSDAGAL